jgi:6-phosphogluconolactonase
MTQPNAPDTLYPIYVGTYTQTGSQGIYLTSLDVRTGRMTEPVVAAVTPGPSFLAVPPDRRHLYAVVEQAADRDSGSIRAFRINPATGQLILRGEAPSGGRGPCHLIVDPAGRNVLTANYGSGTVAVLPLCADGGVSRPGAILQHAGSGRDPQRQAGPHAHSINLDAAGRFAFAADLGLDKILTYRYDAAGAALRPHDPPFAPVHPGAGPRHFAFHPSGRLAYLINELDSTVTGYVYDAPTGVLRELETVSALPAGCRTESYCAEIRVHPSGRFLYGSNRGHDSIAVWAIDAVRGTLTAVDHTSTGGRWPRHFAIDPTGSFLLAANQYTDNLVLFRIDGQTGRLHPTGQSLSIPAPTCVLFV